MATLAEVNVRIGADIAQLQRGLRQAERELLRSGQVISNLGSSITNSVSIPLGIAGVASIKFASDLQTSFTKIENLVGVTGPALDELKNAVAAVSTETGTAQNKVAEAALFITGAGLRGQQALEALSASAKASAVGLGNQADIAKVAGAAVAAYGEGNISASQAVDKLLAIVREGNAEASELAPVLGSVLPIASQLGVSFDEVGANIATFTRLGVGASTAVDGLRSLLSNILKPSEQAAKELAKVGLSMSDVRDSIAKRGLAQTLVDLQAKFAGNSEALARIFGDVQGLTTALATAGAQGEDYVKIVDSISNSTGALDAAFQKTTETAGFKFQKALVDLQNAGIQLGTTLLPAVTGLLNAVTPLLEAFGALPAPVKSAVVGLGLAAVAAGPVITAFGNMRTVVGTAQIAYKSFVGGLSVASDIFSATSSSLTGFQSAVKAAGVAWTGFNTIVKASVIGLAVTTVIALVVALSEMAEKQSDVEKAVSAANVEIEKERSLNARLFDTLKNLEKPQNERQQALDDLKSKYPTYLQNLNLETSSLTDIETAQRRVNEELVRNVALKQKNLAQDAKLEELAKARVRITELESGGQATLSEASRVNAAELFSAGSVAKGVIAEYKKDIQSLEAELQRLDAVFEKTFSVPTKTQSVVDASGLEKFFADRGEIDVEKLKGGGGSKGSGTGKTTVATVAPALKETTVELSAAEKAARDYAEALAIADAAGVGYSYSIESIASKQPQVAAAFEQSVNPLTALGEALAIVDNKALVLGSSFDPMAEKLALVNQAIINLIESGANPFGTAVQFLLEQQAALQTTLDASKLKTEQLATTMAAMGEAGQTIGNAIAAASDQASVSLAAMGQAALKAARQFVAAKIREGVTAAVASALASAGPLGLVLAPIAGAAAAALFNSLIGSLKIPAFAHGGYVNKPTLSLIGEAGPEYVLPEKKIREMFVDGGGGGFIAETHISGQDLRILLKRADGRHSRVTGG